MIRALLLALSGGRRRIGELEAKVSDMERTISRLRDQEATIQGERDAAYEEIAALSKRALRPDPTPTPPANLDDGDRCPEPGCLGHLRWTRIGDCTCHINSPCESCVASPLVCDECEWSTE